MFSAIALTFRSVVRREIPKKPLKCPLFAENGPLSKLSNITKLKQPPLIISMDEIQRVENFSYSWRSMIGFKTADLPSRVVINRDFSKKSQNPKEDLPQANTSPKLPFLKYSYIKSNFDFSFEVLERVLPEGFPSTIINELLLKEPTVVLNSFLKLKDLVKFKGSIFEIDLFEKVSAEDSVALSMVVHWAKTEGWTVYHARKCNSGFKDSIEAQKKVRDQGNLNNDRILIVTDHFNMWYAFTGYEESSLVKEFKLLYRDDLEKLELMEIRFIEGGSLFDALFACLKCHYFTNDPNDLHVHYENIHKKLFSKKNTKHSANCKCGVTVETEDLLRIHRRLKYPLGCAIKQGIQMVEVMIKLDLINKEWEKFQAKHGGEK